MKHNLIAHRSAPADVMDIIDVAYRKCGGAVYKQDGGFLGTDISGFLNKYVLGEKTQIKPGTVTSKDVLEFVPIIGDAIAAKDVADEINKPNPDWLLIGILTAGTVVGLVPGVGDAAAALIKKGGKAVINGSKKAVDTLNQYEMVIDPSTLGSNLGNVQFRKKAQGTIGVNPAELRNVADNPQVKAIAQQMNISTDQASVMLRQSVDKQFDQADAAYEYAVTGIEPRFGKHKSSAPEPTTSNTITSRDKTDLIPDTNPNIGKVWNSEKGRYEDLGTGGGDKKYPKPNSGSFAPEVESVMPFISSMIGKMKKLGFKGQDLADARQDGIVAALEAFEAFKPGSNNSFFTFAYPRIKHSMTNVSGINDATKRKLALEADATKVELDKVISTNPSNAKADRPGSAHDLIPAKSTSNYFDSLPEKYRKLARLLAEKQTIKDNPNVLIDGKTVRTPAVTDGEIAKDLGITVPEMKQLRKELGEFILDNKHSDPYEYLYRKPGKFHKQPESKGAANKGKSLIAK